MSNKKIEIMDILTQKFAKNYKEWYNKFMDLYNY